MQKQKRWQFFLIVAVLALTIYNILPTVFFYTKPLKDPINESRANTISLDIASRVNVLEKDSVEWLESYCRLLKISPSSIAIDKDNPQQVFVTFVTTQDKDLFQKYFPRAGSLIPFAPAQLGISSEVSAEGKKLIVQRQIPVHVDPSSLFSFSFKKGMDGRLTGLYKDVLFDRVSQLANAVAGMSERAVMVDTILNKPNSPGSVDLVFALSHEIVDYADIFGSDSAVMHRFFYSMVPSGASNVFTSLVQVFDQARDQLKMAKSGLKEEERVRKEQKTFVKEDFEQNLDILFKKENLLIKAEALLKKEKDYLIGSENAWTYEKIKAILLQGYDREVHPTVLTLDVGQKNPFIDKILVDVPNEKVFFHLHSDVKEAKHKTGVSQSRLEQVIIDELARITRQTDEMVLPHGKEYVVQLTQLASSRSFLVMKLDAIAKKTAEQIRVTLARDWHPKNPELAREVFPIWDYATYKTLPEDQKALGLVVYAPISEGTNTLQGLKNSSIYVIAKGLDRLLQKYTDSSSKPSESLMQDFGRLREILKQNGFIGYSGAALPMFSEFQNDYLFERDDFYQTLIKATREQFAVKGSKKFAVLEFTDVEQRILTLNQIETKIHEDLLKWKDDYLAAKVSLNPIAKYDVPAPTKGPFWSNFMLSARKYFRGDDRKILHWGLDLSGGKTVQIELRDQNNRVVKNEADLKQGVNELYNRVNKMGVSEVSIRLVDTSIVLDFPGSQGLSAAELIKASSMSFHVVNEKFSTQNSALASHVNRFLQEVWNEAVVTNKKDSESVNLIAWQHLYGDSLNPDIAHPRTESAKALFDNGLRLISPFDKSMKSAFNDTVSKIGIYRGNDFSQWQGQTHPLLIVFNNFALEGSNLDNVRASYDPAKGNFLSFEVRSSYTNKEGQKFYPRDELYAWTSQFAKDKVMGTPLENFSKGRGWRMAVILNDTIISSPTLDSALKDSAMISGSFSQREINQLVADLKAGSLSYTPHILSEKNVSPELGLQERVKGVAASAIALILVLATMMAYYRFAGMVASAAVFCNLLILWATLQNLQATLTLAGIAGIILTVGMAVDANVLVFERIREELSRSGRLLSGIQNGYKRAFSAIFDSNVTTIIAALILLHFDAGPIKSFAVTLLIGIISSLFTALFMTRYFFQSWAQNPAHTTLKMSHWIQSTHFDFLKKAKYAIGLSLVVTVVGGYMLVVQKHAIFGMDFTGGYSVTIEVQEKKDTNYRKVVESALIASGAGIKDFQIRELTPSNNMQLLLGMGMESQGKPFYQLPMVTDKKETVVPYENNPRIMWLVNALKKEGVMLTPRSVTQIDSTWTSMSGQMSDSMRNSAVIGLLIALICIFIYITFRFEYKYATSAIVCLLHDVFICLGSIAILNYLHVPIQIDLHTVAAIMTIIGYSLNDTIIVFDRIREELKIMRKASFSEVVNYALNVTLSRTLLTSGTTLMMLFCLVMFGGSTIFSFSLVMAVGVIFGTLSSLFIATPCLVWMHNYEVKKEESSQESV